MQEMDNPHPAPFPQSIIERIIGSAPAGIVLDPFMGSGTTAVVAKKLNRSFIGIDISQAYCAMAEKRLKGQDWRL